MIGELVLEPDFRLLVLVLVLLGWAIGKVTRKVIDGKRQTQAKIEAEEQRLVDWKDSTQWLEDEDRDQLKGWGFDTSCIPPNPKKVQEKLAVAREIQAELPETKPNPVPVSERKSTRHVHADGLPWAAPSGWFPEQEKPKSTLILSEGAYGGTAVAKTEDGTVVAVSTDLVSAKIPTSQMPPPLQIHRVGEVELKNVREGMEAVTSTAILLEGVYMSKQKLTPKAMDGIERLRYACVRMNQQYQRTPGVKITARDNAQDMADLANALYDRAHEYMTEVHGHDDFRLMF